MIKTWHFLRHGKPSSTGILTGSGTDVGLSIEGRGAMMESLSRLNAIDCVISSPLKRCHDVANEFSIQNALPIEQATDIREMDFGQWDGKPYDWLWQHTNNPSVGEFWQSPWRVTPPEGEALGDFRARIVNWWQCELKNRKTTSHLVVTHAGVIKQLLAHLLEIPLNSSVGLNCIEVPYAAVIKIEVFIDDNLKAWPKVVF